MVNGDIFGIRLWDKGLPYSTIRFPERLEVLEMGLSLERQRDEFPNTPSTKSDIYGNLGDFRVTKRYGQCK